MLDELGLVHPTAASVLAATGAKKSRAYELRAAIEAQLSGILRSPGRPPTPPAVPSDTGGISRAAFAYVAAHPGALVTTATRNTYSDGYRHVVLDLVESHPDLDIAQLAQAVLVPLPTLQDWLATPQPSAAASPQVDPADEPRIASIVEAWRRWKGGFSQFCVFVRGQLAIPYGDDAVRRILASYTDRRPLRRSGRSPDEKALRGAFLTFFPGAQWVEDGSTVKITVNGKSFSFNWELCVDAYTGAFVGASLRDEEDSRAVVEAFEDGVATTGGPPIALSTDNRASNHTPEVAAALGETLHIRATLGRPQSDSPIEGGFGLFQQSAPPLVIDGDTPCAMARAILALVLTVWGRAANHRPRNDRRGRTRVQLYRGERPTDEQIVAARAALKERLRLQDLAFRTRQARLDPVVRALLDETLVRLGLDDPNGRVRDAIARYPHDAVLAAIAVFEGKRTAGTLPAGAGARYLLGIAHKITEKHEGLAIADALLRARLAARDRALVLLDAERLAVPGDPGERLRAFVDLALATDGPLHRAFWLRATSDVILGELPDQHATLFRIASRRIHGTFRV
ncbi:MAG: hypothetical protein H0V89_12560, partial [Deltaproteobacteria bacterium]|nr:hypothetical protein [Deltaproteobacteria bacterium]